MQVKRPFLVKFPATDWKLYQKRLCHGYLPMTIEKIYSVAFFPEHPRVTTFADSIACESFDFKIVFGSRGFKDECSCQWLWEKELETKYLRS